jgi:hypothetical protein
MFATFNDAAIQGAASLLNFEQFLSCWCSARLRLAQFDLLLNDDWGLTPIVPRRERRPAGVARQLRRRALNAYYFPITHIGLADLA